jgi:hypothetical protein
LIFSILLDTVGVLFFRYSQRYFGQNLNFQ